MRGAEGPGRIGQIQGVLPTRYCTLTSSLGRVT